MKKIALVIGILIAFLLCGTVSAYIGSNGREYIPTAVSVRSLAIPVVEQQQVSCKILWDTYHGDGGADAGFEKYTELVSDLQNKGCTVTPSNAGVTTPGLLSQYNVLIVSAGTSFNSAYTTPEVDAIETFVNNGGGLLILDEWNDYPGQPHVDPVVQRFGTYDIATIPSHDQITHFDTAQPIFSGISSIELFYLGVLSAQSPSTAVAWDGQQAVINVVSGKKVVIIGDCNIFQTDPTSNYINQYDNRKFASNVFTYLCPQQENPKVPGIPEFPSIFLPATMIIGLLGAVLYIKRTREH